jgi:BirA family biotin operon repressor/biotin-[acetyl-CoA-carboxylase] ligase
MCLSISLIKCLKYFEIDAEIKWPNDILVDGKKISGILIENNVRAGKVKSMIFGIGLNINQQSFLNLGASSMALIRGAEFSIDRVSLQLTKEFNHWISFVGDDHKTLKLEYLKWLYGLNKNYRFKSQDHEFEGGIVGVNDFGELEINVLGEKRTFKNKEISFLM